MDRPCPRPGQDRHSVERVAAYAAADGEGRSSETAFLGDFAGDLPVLRVKAQYAVQQLFRKALLTGRTSQAAWRSKPSFYAVSTEDRTINPNLQRFMAARMKADTIELRSSHVSLLSYSQSRPRW